MTSWFQWMLSAAGHGLATASALVAGIPQAAPPDPLPAIYEVRRALLPGTDEPPLLWANPLPAPEFEPFAGELSDYLRCVFPKHCRLPVVYQAALAGDAEWLDQALGQGCSPDERTPGGDTPLCAAVRFGNHEAAKMLLLAGADPNLPGAEKQPPLALASLRRPADMIELLLLAGADPNTKFANPVSERLLEQVIVRDLKNHLQSDRGITPLMACASRGDVEGAIALMKYGAKTSSYTGRYRRYPLNFAATQRFLFLMRILLGRPPDAEPDVLVTVDLSQQRAWLTKDGKVVDSTRISTGREGYATPAGRYVITDKHRWHVSNLYHVAMPWFMRLNCGAIGLHSGYVTGRPASHGCIRLPDAKARNFYQLVEVGDEVQIVR